MFYVYLIESKELGVIYTGQTNELKKRFNEHKTGLSKYTKRASDWKLIYYEAYTSRSLAIKRESQLKRKAKTYYGLLRRLRDV